MRPAPAPAPARAAAAALVLLALLLPAAAADLGRALRFTQAHAITVGGITIEYLGERHVSNAVFKPGFTYHDFKVSDGRETKTVSWSSGTGEIGPQAFTLGGERYQLELRHSIARTGWLRDDELVLWRDADFQKAAAKKN